MSAEKEIEANASAHNGFQTSSDYNPSITVTVERSLYRTKSLLDAYILLIPLGFFGAHHFYLRRPGWGVLYLFTFGLFGLGWLLDIFRMPLLVKNANNKDMYGEISTQKFDLLDTWVIGFCPITGLLGFHHYRLERIGWGLLYTFTLGLFGLGWLFDNFRMPLLVKRANIKALENNSREGEYKDDQCEGQEPFKGYYLDDVYVLAFNPLGILGLHHFYLKRCGWGTLYLLTVGLFGIGWLVDLVRMKWLVERKNFEIFHHNQGAYYHHSSTPHYGATNLPQSQYHSENTGFQPEYQPGPHDYQPGVPNHQQCPPPNYQPGLPNQQHGPSGMPNYQPGVPNHQQCPPPNYQYGIPNLQQHGPPGMPNCQPGVPSHQSPVNHQPPTSKDDIQLPLSVGEYPDPTNTGFPRANPPPYTQ